MDGEEADGDGDGTGEDGDVTMRPADDAEDEDQNAAEEKNGVDADDDAMGDEHAAEQNGESAEVNGDDSGDDEGDHDAAGESWPPHQHPTPLIAETASLAPAPQRSSHAPPPSAAHMRSLFVLELKFAALRDKLYLERMEEAAAEEEMVLNGTHPALTHLHKILAERREKLHEVAAQRHQESLAELVRAREADKAHVWSWWTVSFSRFT